MIRSPKPLRQWVAEASKTLSRPKEIHKEMLSTESEIVNLQEQLKFLKEENASLKAALLSERRRLKDRISKSEADCQKWKFRYFDVKRVAEAQLDSPGIKMVSPPTDVSNGTVFDQIAKPRLRPHSAMSVLQSPQTSFRMASSTVPPPQQSPLITFRMDSSTVANLLPPPALHSPQASFRMESSAVVNLPPPSKFIPLSRSDSPFGHINTAGPSTPPATQGSPAPRVELDVARRDALWTEPEPGGGTAIPSGEASPTPAVRAPHPFRRGLSPTGSFSSSFAPAPAGLGIPQPPRRGGRRLSVSCLGRDSEALYLLRTSHRWHRLIRMAGASAHVAAVYLPRLLAAPVRRMLRAWDQAGTASEREVELAMLLASPLFPLSNVLQVVLLRRREAGGVPSSHTARDAWPAETLLALHLARQLREKRRGVLSVVERQLLLVHSWRPWKKGFQARKEGPSILSAAAGWRRALREADEADGAAGYGRFLGASASTPTRLTRVTSSSRGR